MKIRITLALAFALGVRFALPALAQQDPNDPGMQDSIIVEIGIDRIPFDSVYRFSFVHVYATTDDSVVYFIMGLHWEAPEGGIRVVPVYGPFPPFPPFWEYCGDTTFDDCIQTMCMADNNDQPMFTDSVRVNFFNYRMVISPYALPQMVVLDTCYVPMFCTDTLCFAPIFIPDTLIIDPPTEIGNESLMPHSFSLSQNYPNPFNASTTIEFSISERGPALLEVYNLLGQRVATLLDGELEPGRYSYQWNGADAPSGVYFYRLTAGHHTQTKRMVMIR
jgi:hypothetical protein